MFTGIIEEVGEVVGLNTSKNNLEITLKSTLIPQLKIDQSIAHNGVCLTVVNRTKTTYSVTAISETLNKTNLGDLKIGSLVNLERAMQLGDRLDGHIVQGHIDQTATCINKKNEKGSWIFTFKYDKKFNNITIEKGSITVNGVSLTVVDSKITSFSVAIIPYTFKHTTFEKLNINDSVNLEFDVLGKYVKKLLSIEKS